MTKHTPATPLPDGLSAERETYRRADAYPRLVDVLLQLAEYWKHGNPVRSGAMVADEAIALLRELGESE
jgi:hypothetical protein